MKNKTLLLHAIGLFIFGMTIGGCGSEEFLSTDAHLDNKQDSVQTLSRCGDVTVKINTSRDEAVIEHKGRGPYRLSRLRRSYTADTGIDDEKNIVHYFSGSGARSVAAYSGCLELNVSDRSLFYRVSSNYGSGKSTYFSFCEQIDMTFMQDIIDEKLIASGTFTCSD